jgi:hypothetical protein
MFAEYLEEVIPHKLRIEPVIGNYEDGGGAPEDPTIMVFGSQNELTGAFGTNFDVWSNVGQISFDGDLVTVVRRGISGSMPSTPIQAEIADPKSFDIIINVLLDNIPCLDAKTQNESLK